MVDFLQESPWLWWLGAALALAAVEMMTLDFMFLMLAIGALVAMVLAALGLGFTGQVVAFALASLLLLFLVRPVLKRRLLENLSLIHI